MTSLNQEHQFDVETIHRDWSDKHHLSLQAHSESENTFKQQLKNANRDKDRVSQELISLQKAMKMKESGVKSDIDRMWSEWQAKLEFQET